MMKKGREEIEKSWSCIGLLICAARNMLSSMIINVSGVPVHHETIRLELQTGTFRYIKVSIRQRAFLQEQS